MSSVLSKQRELLQLAISKTEVSFPSNTLSPEKLDSVGEADKSADLRAENEELKRKIAALGPGGGGGGREEDGQKGSWSVHGNVASRMQQLCALGACSEGDLVAARHLFETCGGKDLFEVANKNGRTCAWLAAREGHVDVLRFLCDVCGSNFLLRVDSQGRSCAWIAAFGGYTKVLQLLKEVVGQDIFMIVDENGTSCAVAAVQGGHVDVARGLRDLCGDGLLLLKDKQGKSCSDLVETVQSHSPDLPPEPEGGGGEMSEFQKALQQLSQVRLRFKAASPLQQGSRHIFEGTACQQARVPHPFLFPCPFSPPSAPPFGDASFLLLPPSSFFFFSSSSFSYLNIFGLLPETPSRPKPKTLIPKPDSPSRPKPKTLIPKPESPSRPKPKTLIPKSESPSLWHMRTPSLAVWPSPTF
jgi:hypothetical protein